MNPGLHLSRDKRSPEVPQNWAEVEDAFEKVKLSYDKGKKREVVRFKLMVRFEKPGSQD